jgi:hypothetical protein
MSVTSVVAPGPHERGPGNGVPTGLRSVSPLVSFWRLGSCCASKIVSWLACVACRWKDVTSLQVDLQVARLAREAPGMWRLTRRSEPTATSKELTYEGDVGGRCWRSPSGWLGMERACGLNSDWILP